MAGQFDLAWSDQDGLGDGLRAYY